MSRNKKMIEIFPEEYCPAIETRTFGGFRCPKCLGKKPVDDSPVCGYCAGAGNVKAKIEIRWVPDELK